MDIRPPADVAGVESAAHLFDERPRRDATERFLASPIHHLLFAYDGARPVGFVTGVEETHPDKGTEMFLYELAVEERARDQGIGRALVAALATIARDRGCYGMYVLTDTDNAAAIRAYGAAGGVGTGTSLMLEWTFTRE
jgi:ribosomal protein S18 acetylase RimI-like enzyme